MTELRRRSLDVLAYARCGSLLARSLAARWQGPSTLTFTNQRSSLDGDVR